MKPKQVKIYIGDEKCMEHENMREKIDSISAIRGLACLGVFLAHLGFQFSDGVGKCCVSIFLLLSGFVMIYSYYGMNRISKVSIVDNVIFSYRKTKSLYPLYLVTTCMMAVFLFVGQDTTQLLNIAIQGIMNLLIVQEWLPIRGSSINYVSWYFCVVVCSYFIFPWVLRRIETSYTRKKAMICLAVLYGTQALMGIIGSKIPSPSYISNGLWRQDFTVWFVFNFPPVRIIDFLIGCNLGYLFLCRKDNKVTSRSLQFTIAELYNYSEMSDVKKANHCHFDKN